MRFKDIVWITSLLGLFYLHALARERAGKTGNITLKMIVRDGGKEKIMEQQYNSFDALRSDTLWSGYDLELQFPDAPDSTDSSLWNFTFNAYISTRKDTAEAEDASYERKMIIEKRTKRPVTRLPVGPGEVMDMKAETEEQPPMHCFSFKFDREDSAGITGERRTIEITIHSESEKDTK